MATDLEIINSALIKLGAGLITSDQKTNGSTKEARLGVERLPHVRKSILRSHPWNFAIKRTSGSPLFNTIIAEGTTLTHYTTGGVWKWVADAANPNVTYIDRQTTGGLNFWSYVVSSSTKANNFGWNSDGWDIDVMQSPPLTGWGLGSGATVFTDPSISYSELDKAGNSERGDLEFGFSYRIKLPTDCLRLLPIADSDDGDYRVENGYIYTDDSSPELLYVSDVTDYSKIDSVTVEVLSWALAHDMSYSITQSQGVWQMTQQGYRQALATAKSVDAQEDGRYHIEANLFDESRFGSSIFTDYRNHHRP